MALINEDYNIFPLKFSLSVSLKSKQSPIFFPKPINVFDNKFSRLAATARNNEVNNYIEFSDKTFLIGIRPYLPSNLLLEQVDRYNRRKDTINAHCIMCIMSIE